MKLYGKVLGRPKSREVLRRSECRMENNIEIDTYFFQWNNSP
jgi:hypothetical protein